MSIILVSVLSLILFSILSIIGSFFFIGIYAALRVLRISVNWVTWMVGTVIMVASIVLSFSALISGHPMALSRYSSLLGGVSSLVAIFSAGQWVIRRWYVSIKRYAASSLVKWSKDLLLFLRRYHPFFGWIVTLTAVAHMIYYLPMLSRFTPYEIITGFIAMGVLVISVLLGYSIWLQTTVRKQRVLKRTYTIHSILAIAFFAILIFGHFGASILGRIQQH